MREILESCVRIDESAQSAYLDMQAKCTDAGVATMLGWLAAGKSVHAGWWRDLLEEWDAGRLPDVWSQSEGTTEELEAIAGEISLVAANTSDAIDAPEALQAAARIEFLALDPVFSELIELSEPGLAHARHEAWDAHINAVAAAVDDAFGAGSPDAFMSTVLRRTRRHNQAVTRFATRDALTGLGNRRALAAQAGQWASWSARYGGAMSFVLVNVDQFREINDVWGHEVGDRVLVIVAKAIKATVRSADLVTRLGNDEFVVLAPELEPDGARVLAGRLLANIRALKVPAGGDAYLTLTASAGIATVFDPPDSQPRALNDMLAAADRSLASAEPDGRDGFGEPVVLITTASED
jgi:diguanylate cyclase (GGDEF)-like protein